MWKEIQKAEPDLFNRQKTDAITAGQSTDVPSGDDSNINSGSSVAGQKKNEAITGQPADTVTIPPPGGGGISSPSIQSGPSKMSDWMKGWITFSEFVKNVFDNERIFAKHELQYLKKNSSGLSEQKEAEKKIEEMAKKMNEEIYEDMMDKVDDDDWRTENPFEDRNDWRRIISSDGTNTQPPMFTDSSDTIPMMEKDRTSGGMFSDDRKLNRQVAKTSDGDE